MHRDQKHKLLTVLWCSQLEKEKVGLGRKAVEKRSVLNFGPVYLFVRIGFSNKLTAAEKLKKEILVTYYIFNSFHPWECTGMKRDKQEGSYHCVNFLSFYYQQHSEMWQC